MSAFLKFENVAAKTPEGRLLFEGLSISIEREVIGLVGRNGAGKSTLLAIAKGETAPNSGRVTRLGSVRKFEQRLSIEGRVMDALGVSSGFERLRRLEVGTGTIDDAEHADWDLRERVKRVLKRVGLTEAEPDRPLASLSGGELTRVGLAAAIIDDPDVLLLDEPTNNLDSDGRAAIAELLAGWAGGALIASHDRELLENVDRIVQLSSVGVFSHGGGWGAFVEARQAARSRAITELRRVENEAKVQGAFAQKQLEKKKRRDRTGRVQRAKGGQSKLVLNAKAEQSERSGGRGQLLAARQTQQTSEALAAAKNNLEVITPLRIDLLRVNLPASRELIRFDEVEYRIDGRLVFGPVSFCVVGPQRTLVSGRNGVGKSTLLRLAAGLAEPSSGRVHCLARSVAYLDQSISFLDTDLNLVENLQKWHSDVGRGLAYEILARFAFRNADAERPAGTLSGGEALRAGLAIATAGSQSQLLILDEPTNNLDLESIEMLENALAGFEGAILLVSHDAKFVDALGFDQEIRLPLARRADLHS